MGCIYQRGRVYWIKYSREGRAYYESSGSKRHEDAKSLLRIREGDIEHGLPITPRVGRMRFEEAADDLLTDYRVNGRKTVDDVERHIEKRLKPFFRQRRLTRITTADVRRYASGRQREGAANATINRELAALRRMFRLAVQGGKLMHAPHVALLHENNVRRGFFERHQFDAVRRHLPASLRGVVTFAYFTGWRVKSEVLTLRWSQVNRETGEVHLEPGTTKNQEGRTFPYGGVDELREAIEDQWAAHEALRRKGRICPWVFQRDGVQVKSLRRAWLTAC